jgi:hypothetical protein
VLEASDWVRSIFDDGKGSPNNWVSLGCVAIMPPAYVPEDAAIQAVNESAGENVN